MHFLADYSSFLLKTLTLLAAFIVVIMTIITAKSKYKEKDSEQLCIHDLNADIEEMRSTLEEKILSKEEHKSLITERKQTQKANKKSAKQKIFDSASSKSITRQRIFVLDFVGDVRASGVNQLRKEITAILTIATEKDEVLICLESGGGLVPHYGLAASQLKRLRAKNIKLIIAIDKIAASGGYLMASVADQILAAPFAIVGSIGVAAALPNFHRFLKNQDIDVEYMTAGEYKRTLTMVGHNTDKGREKFQEQLNDTHVLFKDFVDENRAHKINIEKVATGEYWYGKQALELNLVDKLQTSDDYLLARSKDCGIYKISYKKDKSLIERFFHQAKTNIKESILEFYQGIAKQLPF